MANLLETTKRSCADLAADPGLAPLADRIEARRQELAEPLRVAISGQVSAGKSTLVNALVGRRIAQTGESETTEVNAWFRHGSPETVVMRRAGGGELRAPLEPGRPLQVPADLDRDHLEAITYVLDEPLLARLTVIDTPGLFSPNQEKSERAEQLLQRRTSQAANAANALIYLTQEVPGSEADDRELRAFQSLFGGLGGKAPTNSVLVLSKIDEKWDPEGDDPRSPSAIAADLIARHGRELWKRVWDSRPVIGHIAEIARTGGTISAQELADLAALARYPRRRRLLGGEAGLRRADVPDVAVERRLALRRRLGDFGLFRALELIDGGCDTPGDVLDGLLASSGLPDVVAMVDEVFRDRSDLLRAESVLCGLERDALARESGIDRAAAARMLARIERVRLAPEADALRRLYVIRLACDDADGRLRLGDERRLELRRLLPDGAAAERLGAAPGTPAHELAALARRRWTWWRAKQNQTPISPTLLRVAEEACRAYQQLARGLAIA